MKRLLTTALTLAAFVCSQTYADTPVEAATPSDNTIDTTPGTDTVSPAEENLSAQDTAGQGDEAAPAEVLAAQDSAVPAEEAAPTIKEVGKASSDGANAGKSKWGTFALATGAVAVAVTALILVSQNRGHGSSGSK